VPARVTSDRRPRDIALSLLVLLVPIAILIGINRFVQGGDEPTVVDPAAAVADAGQDGAFPVALPAGLSRDWRTVSASYDPGDGQAVLRVGYLTPSGAGVQLVESDTPAETLIPRELTKDARPRGPAEIGGRQWQRYSARPGELAFVLLERERTVLVVGAASEAELHELAAALLR
jgi:uncharacterized protein DUF4245